MANTVGKQVEEQERVNAEKLKKHLEDKKKQDEENENERKKRMQARLQEVKRGLSDQMIEKERQHKLEVEQTQAYMRKVLDKAARDKSEQELKVKQRQDNLRENQRFIQGQIHEKAASPNNRQTGMGKVLMNEDEIRFNREILE